MNELNIERLSLSDLEKLLTVAGAENAGAEISRDLASGAPQNADGTIDLKRYIAWLSKQVNFE